MTARALLLKAFDDNWGHHMESLQSLFPEVADDEAHWRDPAYAGATDEKGLAQPGTIWWHVGHLEQCTRRYVTILRTRPVVGNPPTAPAPLERWPDPIVKLERARAELREEIARLSDADLQTLARDTMTVAEFLLMVLRHEIWHAGQVVVLRRLYRHHRSQDARP